MPVPLAAGPIFDPDHYPEQTWTRQRWRVEKEPGQAWDDICSAVACSLPGSGTRLTQAAAIVTLLTRSPSNCSSVAEVSVPHRSRINVFQGTARFASERWVTVRNKVISVYAIRRIIIVATIPFGS